jgi:GNAT superfamily N-acetyltransferase
MELQMSCDQKTSVFARFRERAAIVTKTEDVAGLLRRIVARLKRQPLHHNSYVFSLSLDRPINPPLPEVEVEIGQIGATDDGDLEALMKVDPWADSKSDLWGRLAAGWQCYVARHKDQIVSSLWCVDGEFYIAYHGRKFKLAANEIFYRATATTPAFRGKSIMPYLVAQSVRDVARNQGKTYALTNIQITNRSSLRMIAKAGWTRVGRVGFVEILGVRFYYLWGRDAFRETSNRFFVRRV